MSKVKVLVLTGFGLNCDNETAYSFDKAGAKSERVHINSLINGDVNLSDFQILVFGGGFSWGDDHGAGVIQAVRLKTHIGEAIISFIEKGNLVIGICNGFQCIVNLGLLPGLDNDYKTRSVALTFNDIGNFRNDWVNLKVNPNSNSVFTKGIDQIELPVRHGEGKFYCDDSTLNRLIQNNQVVLQYATSDGASAEGKFPHNPNGSLNDIAGICDPTGRIFGLMPHPEAYNHLTNHPNWTLKREMIKRGEKQSQFLGIKLFENAVNFFKE
ncbi:MAG: phosphoribosylformylglycinamidine synthase I [Desulfobacterales bacterium]|nr:phosphoribosylformylglycinamidine synthase I [Desulfobacterales bacterium]